MRGLEEIGAAGGRCPIDAAGGRVQRIDVVVGQLSDAVAVVQGEGGVHARGQVAGSQGQFCTGDHAELDVVNIAGLVEVVLLDFAAEENELGLLPGIVRLVGAETGRGRSRRGGGGVGALVGAPATRFLQMKWAVFCGRI